MPRPPRCRRICGAPQVDTFCPNGCENTEPILLTLDEYEVIRLVDLQQQTHEQWPAGYGAVGREGFDLRLGADPAAAGWSRHGCTSFIFGIYRL